MTLNKAMPLAKEFQRITHKSLFELILPTWMINAQCIPDTAKIDQWLGTPNGVSTKDWLREKHGQRAVEIIETLLDDETEE